MTLANSPVRSRAWNARLCILMLAVANFPTHLESFAAADLASRADVIRTLCDEHFELIHHVRQISARDWASAGVLPQGRNITSSMVDPGRPYQSGDFGTGRLPNRQLLVAAKNANHEFICFWEGTQGGPMLVLMLIQRGIVKPRLLFYAIMNNDIPEDKWTWEEVKRHVVQNRIDVVISEKHPGAYDDRLP